MRGAHIKNLSKSVKKNKSIFYAHACLKTWKLKEAKSNHNTMDNFLLENT